jgi:hypothetical protein
MWQFLFDFSVLVALLGGAMVMAAVVMWAVNNRD